MGIYGTLIMLEEDVLDDFQSKPQKLKRYLETTEYWELELSNNQGIVDLDKAWDGLFYLFNETGYFKRDLIPTNRTNAKIIFSNQIIKYNTEREPAHFSTAKQVKEIIEFINPLTEEELREIYHPQKMENLGVYPGPGFWEIESEFKFEYLLSYFSALREFYNKAAVFSLGTITIIG